MHHAGRRALEQGEADERQMSGMSKLAIGANQVKNSRLGQPDAYSGQVNP